MAIGKYRLDRVVAYGFQLDDIHLALAGLQHFLAGAVALHFRRRRVHTHQFKRNPEFGAVRKRDFKNTGLAVNRQRRGNR